MKGRRKLVAAAMAAVMVFGGTTIPVDLVSAETVQTEEADGSDAPVFTFTDSAISVSDEEASGYKMDGTALTIQSAGTYVLTGSCSDGSVTVKKGTTDVIIVLNGLDLTSASTAPILCKATTGTTILAAEGSKNTLTDAAANADETSDTAEKAVIKANKQSSLTLCGTGELTVNANAKNGIKGGAQTDLVISEETLHVKSVDNAVASDNSVTIQSGTLDLDAGGDGIKSIPDDDDTDSTGNIVLTGGTYTIKSVGDAIQAGNNLTVSAGDYKITANGGASTTLASDADSCKGLKAGNELTVNGGTFQIDSADDAVHSNAYVTINDGTFTIATGDDGMHADTSLIVGNEGTAGVPVIHITACYEGLEGGTVYIYNGDIDVVSSDDGINAAGGSSNGSGGTQPGPGGDGFNPGGGRPGGMGGRSASDTAAAGNMAATADTTAAAATSDYAIYVYGGDIYVNAGGDGLDSNGTMTISGGNLKIYGAAAGGQGSDNAPLDADGDILINGGTIFGAGSSQMTEYPSTASTQTYLLSTKTTYNAGATVNIMSGDDVLYTETLEKRANYIFYSAPEMTASGSYTIKTGTISGSTGSSSGNTGGNDQTTGSGSGSGSTDGNDQTAGTGSSSGSDQTTGTESSSGSDQTTGTDSTTEIKNGSRLTDTKGKAAYIVLDAAKHLVSYAGTTNKKATSITILATVKIDGTTYQVTAVADKAFAGNKKIKAVTIGKNVKSIGKKAFYGASGLKKITVKTKKLTAKTVGSKAFTGTAKKVTVKTPSGKKALYHKIFLKKGLKKTAAFA